MERKRYQYQWVTCSCRTAQYVLNGCDLSSMRYLSLSHTLPPSLSASILMAPLDLTPLSTSQSVPMSLMFTSPPIPSSSSAAAAQTTVPTGLAVSVGSWRPRRVKLSQERGGSQWATFTRSSTDLNILRKTTNHCIIHLYNIIECSPPNSNSPNFFFIQILYILYSSGLNWSL